MKNALFLALATASLTLASCGGNDTIETTTTTEMNTATDSTMAEEGVNRASIPDSNTNPESAPSTTAPATADGTTTAGTAPAGSTTAQ